MIDLASLNALYSAQVVLWVEDVVTRDYLNTVWDSPPEIALHVAAGNESIIGLVENAVRHGIGHVFGLLDRDFGRTNRDRWTAAGGPRLFRLPRHEIENYALQADAIHGCALRNRPRTQADVEARLLELASAQPAWLACRRVLWEMRSDTQGGFPAHPRLQDITSVPAAESAINSSTWFQLLPNRATFWAQPGVVRRALLTAESEYAAALAAGQWVDEFSGKELFRRIREYVYQPPQNPGAPDSDFIKAVGEWQRGNGHVAAELAELHTALRVRVGLLP